MSYQFFCPHSVTTIILFSLKWIELTTFPTVLNFRHKPSPGFSPSFQDERRDPADWPPNFLSFFFCKLEVSSRASFLPCAIHNLPTYLFFWSNYLFLLFVFAERSPLSLPS